MMPADGYPPTRTFGVLLEINRGREQDRQSEFIDFFAPETGGPEQTLKAIAVCRVETEMFAAPEFKSTGKNWKVISVIEVDEISGPAEPGATEH